jgi:hypothetical protein
LIELGYICDLNLNDRQALGQRVVSLPRCK